MKSGIVPRGEEAEIWTNSGVQGPVRYGKALKSCLWVGLVVMSVIKGRRILTTTFPFPICLAFMIQCVIYVCFTTIACCNGLSLLRAAKQSSPPGGANLWKETALIVWRNFASSIIKSIGWICMSEVLLHYTNLHVLAMLPILTYVVDSIITHSPSIYEPASLEDHATRDSLPRAGAVLFCMSIIVYEDYRLDVHALGYALFATLFYGFFKVFFNDTNGALPHNKANLIHRLLRMRIPVPVVTLFFAWRFEDIEHAVDVARSLDHWDLALVLIPTVLLHIIFKRRQSEVHKFCLTDTEGNAAQFTIPHPRTAVSDTLHASLFVIVIGSFEFELNYLDPIQVFAFTAIYVASVGPTAIGSYPRRLLSLLTRLTGKSHQPLSVESEKHPVYVLWALAMVAIFLSSVILFMTRSFAYDYNATTWLDPPHLIIDTGYQAPKDHLLDIVIAHSRGDSRESALKLIAEYSKIESVLSLKPHFIIYTKDAQSFGRPATANLSVEVLRDTGGISASYLNHIVRNWDSLATQTLFLSTSSPITASRSAARLEEYFIPATPPTSLSRPAFTAFLNLGEYSTCQCDRCYDHNGWADTLHLIPSMWGAVRHTAPCKSVLLTHGDNFVASAARIRGVRKDIWELLYESLTNEDLRNAWAHEVSRLPTIKQALNGEGDSLEKPYMGYTMERLWGIMMQCSNPEIAWGCPNMARGWRRGGRKSDCGCMS